MILTQNFNISYFKQKESLILVNLSTRLTGTVPNFEWDLEWDLELNKISSNTSTETSTHVDQEREARESHTLSLKSNVLTQGKCWLHSL